MQNYNNGINPFDVRLITVILAIYTLFILGMMHKSINPALCIDNLPKHMIRVDPSLTLAPNLELATFEDFESVDYYVVTARVTAYAPFDNQSGLCADGTPSTTSVGHLPSSAFIAVDPSLIPYGTKVYIPGYGLTTAGDTGGALRSYNGYAIDVFMDTYEEAMDFGIQYLEVRIYDNPSNQ